MAERPGPDPPLGLSQLAALDRVSVQHRAAGFNSCKYVVLSPSGEVVLYAKEDTGAIGQILGGKARAFLIDVFDTQDRKVFSLRRPYTIGPDKMEVLVGGKLASVVRQEATLLKPVLQINGAEDGPLLRVKGPIDVSGVCDFEVLDAQKRHVGVIGKRWSGLRARTGDGFMLQLPAVPAELKAAVVGTCFLIDFLYFEN